MSEYSFLWSGYIGVDPGKSGGIALISPGNPPRAWAMPATEREVWDLVHELSHWPETSVIACIEAVHSMPKQGVASTFTFGKGYGGVRMALVAAGIPFREVQPRAWQKALGCLTGGDKNVSLRIAQQRFPNAPWGKTKAERLAIADALLIAEWLRQQP